MSVPIPLSEKASPLPPSPESLPSSERPRCRASARRSCWRVCRRRWASMAWTWRLGSTDVETNSGRWGEVTSEGLGFGFGMECGIHKVIKLWTLQVWVRLKVFLEHHPTFVVLLSSPSARPWCFTLAQSFKAGDPSAFSRGEHLCRSFWWRHLRRPHWSLCRQKLSFWRTPSLKNMAFETIFIAVSRKLSMAEQLLRNCQGLLLFFRLQLFDAVA